MNNRDLDDSAVLTEIISVSDDGTIMYTTYSVGDLIYAQHSGKLIRMFKHRGIDYLELSSGLKQTYDGKRIDQILNILGKDSFSIVENKFVDDGYEYHYKNKEEK